MKKTLLGLLSYFIVSAHLCFANPCCTCEFEPYIGVVGGASCLSGKYVALVRETGERHFARVGDTSGLLGGTLGAQVYFGGCFFALQGNALYHTLNKTVRSSTNDDGIVNHAVALKNHFQWGIDARLGTRFCGATPYVLGGVEAGKWTLKLRNESDTSNRGIPPDTSFRFHKTLWGPKVGVGVLFPLTCHLIGNLEYSYTWFGKIRTSLTDIGTGDVWSHRSDIRQNSFIVGLNLLL